MILGGMYVLVQVIHRFLPDCIQYYVHIYIFLLSKTVEHLHYSYNNIIRISFIVRKQIFIQDFRYENFHKGKSIQLAIRNSDILVYHETYL